MRTTRYLVFKKDKRGIKQQKRGTKQLYYGPPPPPPPGSELQQPSHVCPIPRVLRKTQL